MSKAKEKGYVEDPSAEPTDELFDASDDAGEPEAEAEIGVDQSDEEEEIEETTESEEEEVEDEEPETETQVIPKYRFDEVNEKRKQLEEENRKLQAQLGVFEQIKNDPNVRQALYRQAFGEDAENEPQEDVVPDVPEDFEPESPGEEYLFKVVRKQQEQLGQLTQMYQTVAQMIQQAQLEQVRHIQSQVDSVISGLEKQHGVRFDEKTRDKLIDAATAIAGVEAKHGRDMTLEEAFRQAFLLVGKPAADRTAKVREQKERLPRRVQTKTASGTAPDNKSIRETAEEMYERFYGGK